MATQWTCSTGDVDQALTGPDNPHSQNNVQIKGVCLPTAGTKPTIWRRHESYWWEILRRSGLQPFDFSLCSDYSSPTHIPTGWSAAGARALTTARLFHPPKKTFFVWDVSKHRFQPHKHMLPSAGPARKCLPPQLCPSRGGGPSQAGRGGGYHAGAVCVLTSPGRPGGWSTNHQRTKFHFSWAPSSR